MPFASSIGRLPSKYCHFFILKYALTMAFFGKVRALRNQERVSSMIMMPKLKVSSADQEISY
jgi:hypothetical protein